jgi:hypothetical protein
MKMIDEKEENKTGFKSKKPEKKNAPKKNKGNYLLRKEIYLPAKKKES